MLSLLGSYSIHSLNKIDTKDVLKKNNQDINAIRKTTGIKKISTFQSKIEIKTLFNNLLKIAIKNSGTSPSAILVCTQTPDEAMPAISTQIVYSNKLNKVHSCYDINSGCTGFVDLSRLAHMESLINSESIVYCFSGDINSKIVDHNEYALSCVFGDLLNISIFRYSNQVISNKKLDSNLLNYHVSQKHSDCIKREINGTLIMKGLEVMSFVSDTVIPSLLKYLTNINNESISEYSLILHQANEFIINFINKKIKKSYPKLKLYDFCMQDIGNTGSSTIPFTIQNYYLQNKIKGKVIICGYGVGMSVSINTIYIPENISENNIIIRQI
tara:strand:- start:6567 stop:7550 length:984 start_codon:yes stop_codon:yes gene_type:complete